MLKRLTVAAAFVIAIGSISSAHAAISITPTAGNVLNCPLSPVCLFAIGNDTSQNDIDAILASIIPGSVEIYKQNVGEGTDSGSFAASYATTFNPAIDPLDATITWAGGLNPYITSNPVYALVKDGSQVPAWYLFKITDWSGQETLEFTNFWPAQGAISHVALYGTGTSVPDGGMTLMLLGGALVGLERLRRRFRS